MRGLGGRKGEAQDEAGYIHMISVDMEPITLERILSRENLQGWKKAGVGLRNVRKTAMSYQPSISY